MGAVPRRASAVPAAIPQAVGIPPPAHVRQRWAWTGAGEGSLATLRARPFGLADPRGMPGHPPTSPNLQVAVQSWDHLTVCPQVGCWYSGIRISPGVDSEEVGGSTPTHHNKPPGTSPLLPKAPQGNIG